MLRPHTPALLTSRWEASLIRLLAFAICLALLATTSASAQTSKADPVFLPLVDRFVPMADIPPPPTPGPTRSAGPVSAAQVDRFLRVLPYGQKFNIDPQLDEGRLARLERLNPGQEQDPRVTLPAGAACRAAPPGEAAIRPLRPPAPNPGPENLNRLIAYYTGPDSRALDRL